MSFDLSNPARTAIVPRADDNDVTEQLVRMEGDHLSARIKKAAPVTRSGFFDFSGTGDQIGLGTNRSSPA